MRLVTHVFGLSPDFTFQTICCSRAHGGGSFVSFCIFVRRRIASMVFSASPRWLVSGDSRTETRLPSISPRQMEERRCTKLTRTKFRHSPRACFGCVGVGRWCEVARVVKLEPALAALADFSGPGVCALTAALASAKVAACPPPVDVQLTQCQQFIDCEAHRRFGQIWRSGVDSFAKGSGPVATSAAGSRGTRVSAISNGGVRCFAGGCASAEHGFPVAGTVGKVPRWFFSDGRGWCRP